MVDSSANTDRIAYVEILSSGDAVGSSHFISLSCKRNRCVLTIKDRETSKAREKKRKIKTDRIVYDTIVNIIGEYDLTKLKNLPMSQIQLTDAASRTLVIGFESGENFILLSSMELPKEAHMMWSRLEECIDKF